MKVKIVRIDKDLPLPEYQTEGSVAFDIYSREDAIIEPGKVKSVASNFIIEVPVGYMLMIAARSSLQKKGLRLANSVGIIDQDFQGPTDEIRVLLHNFFDTSTEIKRGDRIAQGLIVPIQKAEWDEVSEIKKDSRGGFGSTG
ncbi:MAG: dUTP diphosphatase [bacterium]|nr:dUTP diphosphatase [bacterium]